MSVCLSVDVWLQSTVSVCLSDSVYLSGLLVWHLWVCWYTFPSVCLLGCLATQSVYGLLSVSLLFSSTKLAFPTINIRRLHMCMSCDTPNSSPDVVYVMWHLIAHQMLMSIALIPNSSPDVLMSMSCDTWELIRCWCLCHVIPNCSVDTWNAFRMCSKNVRNAFKCAVWTGLCHVIPNNSPSINLSTLCQQDRELNTTLELGYALFPKVPNHHRLHRSSHKFLLSKFPIATIPPGVKVSVLSGSQSLSITTTAGDVHHTIALQAFNLTPTHTQNNLKMS